MAQEKEIKIKLKIPFKDFIKRLNSEGYQLKGKSNQVDIYIDKPDWSLYKHISSLRIRYSEGKEHSFNYKKVFYLPNKRDPYYIEEIEVHFPIKKSDELDEIFEKLNIKTKIDFPLSASDLSKILINSGFQDEQKMPKIREKYETDDVEVVIDEIEKLGTIIELECKNSEPLEQVEKLLKPEEWERSIEGTGYLWLRINKGFKDHIQNMKRFQDQPDWNVLENEREFYKEISG